MNKILLNKESLEFIMQWCEKNIMPIEKAPIVLTEYTLSFSAGTSVSIGYKAKWLDEQTVQFDVVYSDTPTKIEMEFLADYRYGSALEALAEFFEVEVPKFENQQLPFVVHVSPLKENQSFTEDGETYANLISHIHMYLMFFMAHFQSDLVEYEDKEVTKKVKKSGKKKAKSVKTVTTQVFRLTRFVHDVQTGKKKIHRKYTKCTHSFGVRGHYRHYKNGKTVWIASYQKNANKKKEERDKVYKFDFNSKEQEAEEQA